MTTVIFKDEMRQARTRYKCDAFDWFESCDVPKEDLTADQQLLLDAARADKGRILPGQMYSYRRGVHDGEMFTWRSRPGMDSLCSDHGLYDDD